MEFEELKETDFIFKNDTSYFIMNLTKNCSFGFSIVIFENDLDDIKKDIKFDTKLYKFYKFYICKPIKPLNRCFISIIQNDDSSISFSSYRNMVLFHNGIPLCKDNISSPSPFKTYFDKNKSVIYEKREKNIFDIIVMNAFEKEDYTLLFKCMEFDENFVCPSFIFNYSLNNNIWNFILENKISPNRIKDINIKWNYISNEYQGSEECIEWWRNNIINYMKNECNHLNDKSIAKIIDNIR